MDDYRKRVMNDKRKSFVIFAALLIFIPLLTMDMVKLIVDESILFESISFMDILDGGEHDFQQLKIFGIFLYPIVALSIYSLILNLSPKPSVFLSVIVGILALGLYIYCYSSFAGYMADFDSFTLPIAWDIMGIGFVLLVVSPFLKKS